MRCKSWRKTAFVTNDVFLLRWPEERPHDIPSHLPEKTSRFVFFFKLHSLLGNLNNLAESLGWAYPGDLSELWTLPRGKFQEAIYKWQLLLELQVPWARPWALHAWSSCSLNRMGPVRPRSEQCLGPETNLGQTLNSLNLSAEPFDSAWSASFCLTTGTTIISLPGNSQHCRAQHQHGSRKWWYMRWF